jgi:hypothetical protein
VKTPLVEAQIADQAKARGISEEAVMKDVILAAQPTKQFVTFDQLNGMLLYLVSDAGASANGAAFSSTAAGPRSRLATARKRLPGAGQTFKAPHPIPPSRRSRLSA